MIQLLYSVLPCREGANHLFGPFQFSKNRSTMIRALAQPVDGRSVAFKKHKLSLSKRATATLKAKEKSQPVFYRCSMQMPAPARDKVFPGLLSAETRTRAQQR